MKKLTTFQITLLAVFGALGLAGIMIFALVTSVGSTSTLGNVVIWGTFPEAKINIILKETIDSDNRFSGVNYVQKDPAKYESDLTTALANGRGPDLFFMRGDYAIHDASYAVHIPASALSPSQFTSTFLDSTSVFVADDGILAVPLLVDPLVLFWNKDFLASAGYTKPPEYWKDVPSMVEKLVTKSESGSIEKSGIALGGFDNISSAKAILTTMILQAGGGITAINQDGNVRSVLGSKGGTGVALTALSFYTEFADPSRDDYSWTHAFPDAAAAFAAGDLAMYIGHSSERILINKANPNLNFGIAPIPQIQKGASPVTSSNVYGLAVSRVAQNSQGALTIAYLMGAQLSEPIAERLNMTSALRRVVDVQKQITKSTDDTSTALQKLVADAPKTEADMLNFEANISKSWLDPDPVRTNAIFRAMIEDTVSGAQKITDAVQRADAQIADILGP